MAKEITNEEILNAVNDFASHVEGQFEQVDKRFDGVESRLDKIEATMVTKDYLDDKLADLRGDLVVLVRKEDTKVKTLVDTLQEHGVITNAEVRKILSMDPFPQNM